MLIGTGAISYSLAHYQTTGPEIWQQTKGEITHFITGLGTTGTFVGVGRFLKNKDSNIKVHSFQPDALFHGLEGLKHLPSVHVPAIYDDSFLDGNSEVSTEEAYAMMGTLAKEEGHEVRGVVVDLERAPNPKLFGLPSWNEPVRN